jgi:hypothetical protein
LIVKPSTHPCESIILTTKSVFDGGEGTVNVKGNTATVAT